MNPYLYLGLLFFELIFLMGATVYCFMLIFSHFKGAPYVPTSRKVTKEILDFIKPKKGQEFLEIGCGDGRVVRYAVKHFGVKGIGIDINPILLWWAQLKDKIQGVKITYKIENLLHTNYKTADIIYIFLMPEIVEKIKKKLETETKKSATIISHGFRIHGWEKYNYKTITRKPFSTFFYKLKK